MEEFGRRDDHFEEDEQIISRETIEKSIDNGEAYRIMLDGRPVGGVIITVDGKKGDPDILFTSPKEHSKGIGYKLFLSQAYICGDCAIAAVEPRDLL